MREGGIAGGGKAGNRRIMDGVHPGLVCGPSTVVAHGERPIATPSGIDVHVHFKSPDPVRHALATGFTTLVGGGHGLLFNINSGGAWTTGRMLQATDALPMNVGFLGRGSTSRTTGVLEHVASGIIGIKVHEDYGVSPAVIDTALGVADDDDFQVQRHTDTLNESGFHESWQVEPGEAPQRPSDRRAGSPGPTCSTTMPCRKSASIHRHSRSWWTARWPGANRWIAWPGDSSTFSGSS